MTNHNGHRNISEALERTCLVKIGEALSHHQNKHMRPWLTQLIFIANVRYVSGMG